MAPTDDGGGAPDTDLRELEFEMDMADDEGRDTGALTKAVRSARKRLARRRVKRKAKALKRRKRIEESDPVQAGREAKRLVDESPAASKAAGAARRVRQGAASAAEEVAAVDVDGDGRTDFVDADGDGRLETRVPEPRMGRGQRPGREFDAFLDEAPARDRNPAVDTFIDDRGDDSQAERNYDNRALGPFDIF